MLLRTNWLTKIKISFILTFINYEFQYQLKMFQMLKLPNYENTLDFSMYKSGFKTITCEFYIEILN